MSLQNLIQSIQNAELGLHETHINSIVASLEHYRALLLDWNTRINLTAITDPEGVTLRHFVDSLTVLNVLPSKAATLIDVGTGAGFPGLVLKIARPEINVVLMDSVAKKVKFCDEVIRSLGLTGIRAVHARAEEVTHTPEYREQFDVVTARAVAALPTLCEYLLPFAKVGGTCIAMKGSDAEAETQQAQLAIQKLGATLNRIEWVSLPNLPDKRALIVLDKTNPTPKMYPRQAGAPRSNPIGG